MDSEIETGEIWHCLNCDTYSADRLPVLTDEGFESIALCEICSEPCIDSGNDESSEAIVNLVDEIETLRDELERAKIKVNGLIHTWNANWKTNLTIGDWEI
jgi:transcription initiation factor IIE alpha subunit